MAQEQTQRQGGGDDGEGGDDSTAAGQERREKLGEDTDTILDEIDDVLEENAEDFVRAYVQKGGQCPPSLRPPRRSESAVRVRRVGTRVPARRPVSPPGPVVTEGVPPGT